MIASGNIRIGIAEAGIRHDMSYPPDLATQFRLVKECGAFDYLDKTPPRAQLGEYARLSERFDLPILAGGWWYTLGRDEGLLADNIRVGAELGSLVHNVQIMMDHADGRLVTDQEVADAYLRAYDLGATVRCLPAFEVHINMWSEDFRRVANVAALVESRGVPFRVTLDHSHVIFKINNDPELKVFGLDAAIAAGDLILDPFTPGNVCEKWIHAGWVAHCHARSAIPNNPRNLWAEHPSLESLPSSRHPRDLVGRGVQYPFIEPGAGEWHARWDERALEPWKEVIRQLASYHGSSPAGPLQLISTEFIPFTDYGQGARYSLFDNSVACARWIRREFAGTDDARRAPIRTLASSHQAALAAGDLIHGS